MCVMVMVRVVMIVRSLEATGVMMVDVRMETIRAGADVVLKMFVRGNESGRRRGVVVVVVVVLVWWV